MRNVFVEKCYECPLACDFDEDFGNYDCEFKPQGIDKEGVNERGIRFTVTEEIPHDTVIPPDWCPLRKEGAILIQLSLDLLIEETDGKSQADQSSK